MNFKPQVIQGGKGGQGQFVCPFCGDTFDARYINSDGVFSLEEHWRKSATCYNNRNVNNPTQSKYNVREDD